MADKQLKVGEPVLRQNVPPHSLVKSDGGRFIWRRGDEGQVVKVPGDEPWGVDGLSWWPWHGHATERVTIIALDVHADATADDLRTLAEVFEVREELNRLFGLTIGPEQPERQHAVMELVAWARAHGRGWLGALSGRLHAAGWRRGMTAEDAARMLAEADKRETLRRDSVLITMLR